MLHGPAACGFGGHIWNQAGIGYVAADGINLTTGAANTYGSYVEVLSDTVVDRDCYAIAIHIFSGGVSASDRSAVVTIGKDEAGGTSYTDWIQHLIVPPQGAINDIPLSNPVYYFPLFVKAGTAIAAKAACVTATTVIKVNIELFHTPLNPEALWFGHYVETFGASASGGTAITLGTTSEGSWTQVGSNPTRPLHYWQMGAQISDATMTTALMSYDFAIGDASNKFIVWEDFRVVSLNTEFAAVSPMSLPPPFYSATTGDLLYVRGQHSSTPDSGNKVALYGVG